MGNWFYEPERSVVAQWAIVQECRMGSYSLIRTPFDDYAPKNATYGTNLECFQYTEGCSGKLMNCVYDGDHGEDPDYDIELFLMLIE